MTTSYTPEKGDYIRVTTEGQVTHVARRAGHSQIELDFTAVHDSLTSSFEKIDPPEPEYEVGKMYESPGGVYYFRGTNDWILAVTGKRVPHHEPRRPLRKLVPEDNFE